MLRSLIAAGILLATLGLAATPALTAPGDSKPRVIAFEPDQRIWTLAFTDRYLAWESEQGEEGTPALFQRDLRTKRQRILAARVHPEYGLASTREWVVYASGLHALFAVRHDGSGRRTLTANLVAPFAGRGERVAWAELDRDTYRVIVRNMATGKQWLAAKIPRCVSTRCYRIDGVTLADGGVVFTRGAIGPQPSFIVRRGFADPAPTSVAVPRDPQPELAPSSAGALYYDFGRGWFRWDFGTRKPRATRFGVADQNTILQYEDGHWLTRKTRGCRETLGVVRPGTTRATLAASQRDPEARPPEALRLRGHRRLPRSRQPGDQRLALSAAGDRQVPRRIEPRRHRLLAALPGLALVAGSCLRSEAPDGERAVLIRRLCACSGP